MKKILLSGEGRNELGAWAADARLQPREGETAYERGVLEALLGRVRGEGWVVKRGMMWKCIPKYKVGEHRDAECRNVLGLVAIASKIGLDAVVFSRDRDGAKNQERGESIQKALEEASSIFGPRPEVVGGIAVERIESWVAALLGTRRSEELKNDAVDRLIEERAGVLPMSTYAMVGAVERADLDSIPVDAASLRAWLGQARRMLEPA